MRLLRNASDVRFIEGRGLPRSRSVSEDGVVEPFENRADGVFRNSLKIKVYLKTIQLPNVFDQHIIIKITIRENRLDARR
jgi:hypothetical protein